MWHTILHALGYFTLAGILFSAFLMILSLFVKGRDDA
jgi:hypothetical protein